MSNPTAYDFLVTSRVQNNDVPVIDLTLPGHDGEAVTTTILETEALWLATRLTHLVYARQRAAELAEEEREDFYADHGHYPEDVPDVLDLDADEDDDQ